MAVNNSIDSKQDLSPTSNTTFNNLKLNGLTASSLIATDSGKNLISGSLTGDITTSNLVATLATVNSNVGTFGDGTHVSQLTVNAKGQITAVSNVLITGAAPTGAAGGDLSGTYPNPTVSFINGVGLGSTTATSGNLLIGSGTQWVSRTMNADATINSTGVLTFATVNSNVGTFGSATQVPQFTVNGKGLITGVTNVTISGVAPGGTAGGDLSGTYPNPTVASINGSSLGSTTPTAGQLLIGSGTQWVTHAISGDGSLTSAGALTISSIGGKAVSLANSFTTSGNFTVTQTYTGNTNVTFPTSGTLATTAGSVPSITGSTNQVLVNGTTGTPISGTAITLTLPQFIGTTSTPSFGALTLSSAGVGLNIRNDTAISAQNIGPINFLGLNASSASKFYGVIMPSVVSNTAGAEQGKILFSVIENGTLTDYFSIDGSTATISSLKTLSLTVPLALTSGGTNASLAASNGGIIYSTASAFAVLAGTATASQMLQSGASGAPSWSTATFPSTATSSGTILRANGTNWVASTSTFADTYTASNLLYSNGSNTVTGLATGNNGLLVTSATGVPSILAGPGSNNKMLMSNSGAAPSWSTPSYPSAASPTGTILRANGTDFVVSTATFANTYLASNLLYSNGSNAVTGLATAVNGSLVTDASGVPSILAGPGSTGNILQSNAAAAPSWSTASYPTTAGTSGNIITSNGSNFVSSSAAGIGSPLTTKGDIYTYSTVNARLAVGTTNGQILQVSSGAATGLAWSTPTYPSASGTAGKILRADGTNNVYSTSTFADTYSASTILYSNGANTVTGLATANSSVLVTTSAGVPVQSGTMTNGQMIIGSTSATPVAGTIGVSGNLSSTAGAGTFALSLTGTASRTVTRNLGTSATLNAFSAVIPINNSLFTFTLSATASVGDEFEIIGRGAGGWLLTLNAGQSIFGTGFATTSGGSVTSTDRYNCLKFVCVVQDTGFVVSSMMGNPTAA